MLYFNYLFIAAQSNYYNNIYSYNSIGCAILNINNNHYIYGANIDSGYQKVFIKKINQDGIELQHQNYILQYNLFHYPSSANNLIKCSDDNLLFCGNYILENTSYRCKIKPVNENKMSKNINLANIFLIKIDTNLNILWSKIYKDTTAKLVAYGLKELPDKGFAISGAIQNKTTENFDMLLIRTDSNGNELWRKQYGGPYWEFAYKNCIQTFDKGFLLGGFFNNQNIGASSNQALIIKTDSNGNQQWQLQLGEPQQYNNGAFVAQLADSNYLIIMDTAIATPNPDWPLATFKMYKINQQRQILWTRVYNKPDALFVIRSLNKINDNEFIISGMEKFRWDSVEYGDYGGFLFKFTAEGDSIWWRNYQYFSSNADWNTLYDVAQNNNGFVSCGSTYPIAHQDSVFTWLISLDSMGCLTPGCETTTGPIITGQPQNDTVYKNHNAVFQLAATGTPVLRYQWQTYNGINWENLIESGQFKNTRTTKLRILNVPFALHQSQYRCKIRNNYDSLYSNTVQLFVDTTENINEQQHFKNCIQVQTLCTDNNINFSCCAKAEHIVLQYHIYDLHGRRIKSGDIFTNENNSISITNLQQGMFFITFAYNKQNIYTTKFFVNK